MYILDDTAFCSCSAIEALQRGVMLDRALAPNPFVFAIGFSRWHTRAVAYAFYQWAQPDRFLIITVSFFG